MTVRSVIIYDRGGHHAAMERSILRASGVATQSFVNSDDGLFNELRVGRDLVLLNWSAPWDGLVALVRAIRHKENSPDPFVAIVVVSSALNASNAQAALDAGVNSLMRVPFSAADIQRQLAVLARPARFIDAPNYFGPDRRTGELEITPEVEARFGAPCNIIEGEVLEAIRLKRRSAMMSELAEKVSVAS